MTAALIIGLGVSMVAALGFMTVRKTDTQLALLVQVANWMKFDLATRSRRARGKVRTHPESDGVQTRVTALGSEGSDHFEVECLLVPPLHMGLELTPRPSTGVWTTSPKLYELFSISARHQEQIPQLFDGWIKRELLRARTSGFVPSINDYSVKMRVHTANNVRLLMLAIEHTARLAEGLVLGRARLPPSELERAVERAFREVAHRIGGSFDRPNLALHVTDESGKSAVYVEHVRGPDWQTVFELRLEHRLVPGVQLADTRASSLWSRWAGQDISVGDEAFDAAFVVRAEREAIARDALIPELRQALLALREKLEHVSVADGLVSGRVDHVLSKTKPLEGAVLAMLAVGDAFAAKRRAGSAYR